MIAQVEFFVFLASLCLFGCLGLLLQARRARRERLLRGRLGELHAPSDSDSDADAGEHQTRIRKLLVSSGIGWSVEDFMFRIVLAGVTGLMLGLFLRSLVLALLLGAAGCAIVISIVQRFSAKRLKQIDTQMPQALEVMVMALRAGHALPNALAVCASEVVSPVREELKRVVDEHAFGRPIGQAIGALGGRLPGCHTVNDFVVAVLVLEETGGNLIAVIERIVQNSRERTAYELRLAALTAQGRTSAKLLAFMPVGFALGACGIDPTYADMMMNDPAGQKLAMFAIGWWLLGILFTRGLLKRAERA